MFRTPTRFAGLMDPFGVAIAEYRRERGGMQVLAPIVEPGGSPRPEAAAERLAALFQARDVGKSPVTVAISGFGAVSHTMTVPAAPRDVLEAVVAREVERIFGIVDPVVAFAVAGPRERRAIRRTVDDGPLPLHLVVCGAPRTLIDAVLEPFRASGLRIETLTLMAPALSRLLGSIEQPTGAATMVATAFGRPFTVFTVDGELALALEPPHAAADRLAALPLLATEQVERGLLFVRQQFRGVVPGRLIVSGSTDQCEEMRLATEGSVGGLPIAVRPADPPEAAILVGAALEAEQREALTFVPRPERPAARLRSAVGVSSLPLLAPCALGLLLLVVALVLAAGVQGAMLDQAELRRHIEERAATLGGLRSVAARRAVVDGERALLAQAQDEHRSLASLLHRIAAAAPPAVQLDSLTVRVGPDGRLGVLMAHAVSPSGAAAIEAIEALFSRIRAAVPGTSATIGDLTWGATPGDADPTRTTVSVSIEFTVPPAVSDHGAAGDVGPVPAVPRTAGEVRPLPALPSAGGSR